MILFRDNCKLSQIESNNNTKSNKKILFFFFFIDNYKNYLKRNVINTF